MIDHVEDLEEAGAISRERAVQIRRFRPSKYKHRALRLGVWAPRVGERRPFYFKAGAETPALLIPPSFRDTILEARFPGTLALGSSVNRVATRLPHVWLSCFWEPTRP